LLREGRFRFKRREKRSKEVKGQEFLLPCFVASRRRVRSYGAIHEFDYVEHLLVCVVERCAGAELQQAAGIRGDDELGLGGCGVLHFSG
jgi:hypothetical protein